MLCFPVQFLIRMANKKKLGEYSIDNNQKDEQSLASHIMSNNRILFDSGTLDALIDQLELAIISETR